MTTNQGGDSDMRARRVVWALSAAVALLGAACSSNVSSGSASGPSSSSSATGAPGIGGTAIRLIIVVPKEDYRHNQAAYDRLPAVKAAVPHLKGLTAHAVARDRHPHHLVNHLLHHRA